MQVSQLTARAIAHLTLVCASVEDIKAHHGLRTCSLDVGDDYAVGRFSGWRGKYWVLEHRTGIVYYTESVRDCQYWIKLGRLDAVSV